MRGYQAREGAAELIAHAIYREIRKQSATHDSSCPLVCAEQGMRNVMIDGHFDLLKVAAVLTKRFGSRVPDIETIEEA